ncbi:hypothetical protein QBC42DRAFT_253118 [Cladorrhinum samala]|uniref:Uncharacterized protein n=1 Tax=Cladorrhinum samala TaxID=585594 RepID=A0AAV9HLI6_9PEZI|nr:hypothetical protein QBC42DRAFT_253118 [Cladorrhinum samala]
MQGVGSPRDQSTLHAVHGLAWDLGPWVDRGRMDQEGSTGRTGLPVVPKWPLHTGSSSSIPLPARLGQVDDNIRWVEGGQLGNTSHPIAVHHCMYVHGTKKSGLWLSHRVGHRPSASWAFAAGGVDLSIVNSPSALIGRRPSTVALHAHHTTCTKVSIAVPRRGSDGQARCPTASQAQPFAASRQSHLAVQTIFFLQDQSRPQVGTCKARTLCKRPPLSKAEKRRRAGL